MARIPTSAAPTKRTTAEVHLVESIARGDRAAFHRLYKGYYRRLFAFATKVTRRTEIADDVVNETMLAVWRSADRFEGRSRVSTWIFGICYRCALAALGRETRVERLIPLEDDAAGEAWTTPDAMVKRLFDRDSVARALQVLSPEQRAVVELTYYHGYDTAEIAGIVGCPAGTVKTRMFAARQRLRHFLRSEDRGEARHG